MGRVTHLRCDRSTFQLAPNKTGSTKKSRSKRVVEPGESPTGWNCSGSIYLSKRHQRCWLEHCKTKGVRNSGNHDVYSLRVSCLMLSKTRSSQSIMKHKFPLTNPDISYLYYIYTPSITYIKYIYLLYVVYIIYRYCGDGSQTINSLFKL